MFSHDPRAAKPLIHILKNVSRSTPNSRLAVALLEIDHHICLGDLAKALTLVEQHLETFKHSDLDPSAPLRTRLRFLNAKSRILIKAGRAQKALSLTLRATTAAHKARLFPVLWESIALLMHVLNSVRCQDLAADLGCLYIEEVRETKDEALLAEMQDALHTSYLIKTSASQDMEKVRNEEAAEHWKQGALAGKGNSIPMMSLD